MIGASVLIKWENLNLSFFQFSSWTIGSKHKAKRWEDFSLLAAVLLGVYMCLFRKGCPFNVSPVRTPSSGTLSWKISLRYFTGRLLDIFWKYWISFRFFKTKILKKYFRSKSFIFFPSNPHASLLLLFLLYWLGSSIVLNCGDCSRHFLFFL